MVSTRQNNSNVVPIAAGLALRYRKPLPFEPGDKPADTDEHPGAGSNLPAKPEADHGGAIGAMDDTELCRKVEALLEQIEKNMRRRSTAGLGPNRGEALRELQTCIEALTVMKQELTRKDEELAAERQKEMQIFNFTPDACIVTDVDGIIKEVNPAARKLFHVPEDTIVNTPLIQFAPKVEHERFSGELSRVRDRATDEPGNWEMVMQGHTAGSFRAAITVSAIRDGLGGVGRLLWLIRRARNAGLWWKAVCLLHLCLIFR